jgi:Crinkler effector protein N-terminal domain
MASLEIFVLVLGDFPASQRMFPITASTSDSVGHLRRLVHDTNQNRFKGIDARELVLWKVPPSCSFPIIC